MPWSIGVTMGSVAFSGASLAKVALDRAYADAAGKYFQSNDGHLIERKSSRISYDEQRALGKLWNELQTARPPGAERGSAAESEAWILER